MKRSVAAAGFTLTELAVVLVIVGLLLASLLPPLSAQLEQRRQAETTQALNEAREALIGYAMTHLASDGKPYLPCPDTDDDGREEPRSATGACQDHLGNPTQEGRLPWSALGVARWDGWNNRLRYRVHANYANSSVGFTLATAPPNLRVCTTADCSATLATQLPAVIVSHGGNGAGAYNAAGGSNAAPGGADEAGNGDADDDFVARLPSGDFDDLVVWLPAPILASRMLAAGRLP